MAKIPDKLKKDAIFQALFDIRFTSKEVTPEIVTGKLASHNQWKGWSVQRLAFADIPAAVRQQDPGLQFQPLIQLQTAGRLVQIGERSLSCHTLAPYPGWTAWEPELRAAIDVLHSSFENLQVTRFGLRYMNAVGPEHFINTVGELRLSVRVADASLAGGPLLLHYQHDRDPEHVALVRVSSREFVVNPQPPDLAAVIDVDVFTPASFSSADPDAAKAWLERAHELEKEEFFSLIPDDIVQKLTEG